VSDLTPPRTPKTRLDPRVVGFGRRWLPKFLTARLDPVEHLIEAEVRRSAALIGSQGVVLDAGAGEARHRNLFSSGLYVALDTATGDPEWDYSRLDVCGDLERIPLRDASVDCVLCMVVLEHTRDPRRVLSEFGRVLKPGASLTMVVPFLWEEHQVPHDYFRFTRYGVHLLFDALPFRLELVNPMGGFFGVCARRCVNLLGFFQEGWRWPLFVLLAPFFGFAFPIALHYLDRLDHTKRFTLGFQVRATRIAS